MKNLLIAAAAAALLAPISQAGEFSVSYSDDFTEVLEEDYGVKEGEYLSKEVIEDLMREFKRADVDPARVEIVIENAMPNRPTFKQLGDKPGLDFARSISIGGMDLKATAYDAEGVTLASYEYGWFENDIRNVVGSSTWSDANRASRRFARKFAKELAD